MTLFNCFLQACDVFAITVIIVATIALVFGGWVFLIQLQNGSLLSIVLSIVMTIIGLTIANWMQYHYPDPYSSGMFIKR